MRREPALERAEELRDQHARDRAEHSLADRGHLAADISLVAITEPCLPLPFGCKRDPPGAGPETECARGLPDQSDRTAFLLVAQLDACVIGATDAGNADPGAPETASPDFSHSSGAASR